MQTTTGSRSPAAHAVAVEASVLELQRAVVVARIMGVAPEWASGSSATPGWWLDTWARRIAHEWLSPSLGGEVVRWLERVHELLEDPDPPDGWLASARAAAEAGVELEARVLAEVGTRES